jgi:hypothetical protein
MKCEKIKWQYITRHLGGTNTTVDPLPLDGFDVIRVYMSTFGVGNTAIFFGGAVTLPSGYSEKDGDALQGQYIMGQNDTMVLTLTGISSIKLSGTNECGLIIQGIKYE